MKHTTCRLPGCTGRISLDGPDELCHYGHRIPRPETVNFYYPNDSSTDGKYDEGILECKPDYRPGRVRKRQAPKNICRCGKPCFGQRCPACYGADKTKAKQERDMANV